MNTFSGYSLKSVTVDLPFDTEGYNIIPKTYPFGEESLLISTGYKGFRPNRYTRNLKCVKIPAHYTEELCKFIGYFIANGSYGENCVKFCTLDKEIAEDFIKISNSLFGVDVEIAEYEESVPSYIINSTIIKDFLVNTVFKGKHTARFKVVPDEVKRSSKSCIRCFILGLLDCDSYLERESSFVFNTASEYVAKFVHEVLLGFGIVSNLRPFNGVKGYEDHTYWNVRVSGKYLYDLYSNIFLDRSLTYKTSPVKRKVNTNFDFIPNLNSWLRDELRGIRQDLQVSSNGTYTEGTTTRRFKILTGFEISPNKSVTYELVDKILDKWQDLPEDQRERVKDVENVLLNLKESNVYFDKIL